MAEYFIYVYINSKFSLKESLSLCSYCPEVYNVKIEFLSSGQNATKFLYKLYTSSDADKWKAEIPYLESHWK